MKRVAIWPSPWNYKLQNQMFDGGFGPGGAYIGAFRLWRDVAAKSGFQLDTWDVVSPGNADLLWFIDLPRRKSIYQEARNRFPGTPSVLMICESPLICPQMFHAANQRNFDLVVSYEPEKPGRIHYKLPVGLRAPLNGPAFHARRLLCMINSNRVEGVFAMRQLGLEGLPGVGRLFNGWSSRLKDFIAPLTHDLYVERRRIARDADRCGDLEIDFFGSGWNGEQISWCPWYRNIPYRCQRGRYVEDRIGTLSQYRFSLAYENWRGSCGYITDRIFDGFLAGTVPVYLGDDGVDRIFPGNAFVDARHFANRSELFSFLRNMKEEVWCEMREAGRNFLQGTTAQAFSEESFARTLTLALHQIIPK